MSLARRPANNKKETTDRLFQYGCAVLLKTIEPALSKKKKKKPLATGFFPSTFALFFFLLLFHFALFLFPSLFGVTALHPHYRINSMFSVSKRKRDAYDSECKKSKAQVGERERELISLSNEWPLYNHPDGGTVKITPWGSLRQYIDPETGELVTRFEDVTFSNYSFAMSPSNSDNQFYELPSTPMSLNATNSARSSPALGEQMRFSPSSEVEQYVVDGYRNHDSKNISGQAVEQPLFGQEQENYFGMVENEDSDMNNDSMVM